MGDPHGFLPGEAEGIERCGRPVGEGGGTIPPVGGGGTIPPEHEQWPRVLKQGRRKEFFKGGIV